MADRDPMTPTQSLDEFLAEFEQDDNVWWRLPCGDHLNLFEELLERYETLLSR